MLLCTLRTCQVVWDLASNSPRFLTFSMAAASNLLKQPPHIHQSGPKDEETDPEQDLWVGLLGTDLSCQDNPKLARYHCTGPGRLSAKISQDTTKRNHTGIWDKSGCGVTGSGGRHPRRPYTVWGCKHHLWPISNGPVLCRLSPVTLASHTHCPWLLRTLRFLWTVIIRS